MLVFPANLNRPTHPTLDSRTQNPPVRRPHRLPQCPVLATQHHRMHTHELHEAQSSVHIGLTEPFSHDEGQDVAVGVDVVDGTSGEASGNSGVFAEPVELAPTVVSVAAFHCAFTFNVTSLLPPQRVLGVHGP